MWLICAVFAIPTLISRVSESIRYRSKKLWIQFSSLPRTEVYSVSSLLGCNIWLFRLSLLSRKLYYLSDADVVASDGFCIRGREYTNVTERDDTGMAIWRWTDFPTIVRKDGLFFFACIYIAYRMITSIKT